MDECWGSSSISEFRGLSRDEQEAILITCLNLSYRMLLKQVEKSMYLTLVTTS